MRGGPRPQRGPVAGAQGQAQQPRGQQRHGEHQQQREGQGGGLDAQGRAVGAHGEGQVGEADPGGNGQRGGEQFPGDQPRQPPQETGAGTAGAVLQHPVAAQGHDHAGDQQREQRHGQRPGRGQRQRARVGQRRGRVDAEQGPRGQQPQRGAHDLGHGQFQQGPAGQGQGSGAAAPQQAQFGVPALAPLQRHGGQPGQADQGAERGQRGDGGGHAVADLRGDLGGAGEVEGGADHAAQAGRVQAGADLVEQGAAPGQQVLGLLEGGGGGGRRVVQGDGGVHADGAGGQGGEGRGVGCPDDRGGGAFPGQHVRQDPGGLRTPPVRGGVADVLVDRGHRGQLAAQAAVTEVDAGVLGDAAGHPQPVPAAAGEHGEVVQGAVAVAQPRPGGDAVEVQALHAGVDGGHGGGEAVGVGGVGQPHHLVGLGRGEVGALQGGAEAVRAELAGLVGGGGAAGGRGVQDGRGDDEAQQQGRGGGHHQGERAGTCGAVGPPPRDLHDRNRTGPVTRSNQQSGDTTRLARNSCHSW